MSGPAGAAPSRGTRGTGGPGVSLPGAPSGPGARSSAPRPRAGGLLGAGIGGPGRQREGLPPRWRGRDAAGLLLLFRLPRPLRLPLGPGRGGCSARAKAKLPARPGLAWPWPWRRRIGPRPGAGVGGGARGRSWEETFALVPTPLRRAALWAPAALGRLGPALKGAAALPAPPLTRWRGAGNAPARNWSPGAWSPHWVSPWPRPSSTHGARGNCNGTWELLTGEWKPDLLKHT